MLTSLWVGWEGKFVQVGVHLIMWASRIDDIHMCRVYTEFLLSEGRKS